MSARASRTGREGEMERERRGTTKFQGDSELKEHRHPQVRATVPNSLYSKVLFIMVTSSQGKAKECREQELGGRIGADRPPVLRERGRVKGSKTHDFRQWREWSDEDE